MSELGRLLKARCPLIGDAIDRALQAPRLAAYEIFRCLTRGGVSCFDVALAEKEKHGKRQWPDDQRNVEPSPG